jgi:hypothetical protein
MDAPVVERRMTRETSGDRPIVWRFHRPALEPDAARQVAEHRRLGAALADAGQAQRAFLPFR